MGREAGRPPFYMMMEKRHVICNYYLYIFRSVIVTVFILLLHQTLMFYFIAHKTFLCFILLFINPLKLGIIKQKGIFCRVIKKTRENFIQKIIKKIWCKLFITHWVICIVPHEKH